MMNQRSNNKKHKLVISNCNWCLKPEGQRIYATDVRLCPTYKMATRTPKKRISTFPHLLVVATRVVYRVAFAIYGPFRGWNKRSSISSALIRSPTQKVGMGLLVKLQTMQQLTILVTFFQIRRV